MKKLLLKFLWMSLRIPAQILLFRFKPRVIAITGSVGKTTTKDAVFWILDKNPNLHTLGIRKNIGNLNTEIGAPLTILGFKKTPENLMWVLYIFIAFFKAIFTFKYPRILILEMAADKPGDIKYLTSFIKPEISIVTNIGLAHLEAFKTIEKIAQEKSIIVKILKKDNHAILNIDDENTRKMGFQTQAKVVYFGKSSNANIYIDNIQENINGLNAKIHYGGSTSPLFMKSTGKSNIYAGLIAITVACEIFHIDLIEATKSLFDFKPSKGRGNIFKGQKNSIIIDDTYNANPLSMMVAFENLNNLAKEKVKKIVILGEMFELGADTDKYHREVGGLAGKYADYVLVLGKQADNYIKGAKQNISNTNNIQKFSKPNQISKYLLEIISKNDIILVKGSRGAKMERVIKLLIK